MTTFYYSVLHFLVDGICAAAMFSRFLGGSRGYWWILAYNFCAFVLQMPFGAVLDGWSERDGNAEAAAASLDCAAPAGGRSAGDGRSGGGSWRSVWIDSSQRKAFVFALAGVFLTVVGAFTSPVILGIGNALFHVGGGVGTIIEDRECGSAGRRLGVFVAPGAMGLFLGKVVAQSGTFVESLNAGVIWVVVSAAVAVVMLVALWRALGSREIPMDKVLTPEDAQSFQMQSHELLIIAGCFCVVVLRSYVGMAVAMPWRTTVAAGVAATAAVVLGKIAGGFLAASLGRKRTVVWSLLAAAVCYAFCDKVVAGILALLLFNMTMPVTLQILVDRYRGLPGTMFGLLTVGLFVGFLPVYFAVDVVGAVSMVGAADAVSAVGELAPGGVVGAVLSLVSLAMLWVVCGIDGMEGVRVDVGEGA